MFRKITKKKVLKSLSRHKDITKDFLKQINNTPKEILENLGNDLAKKAVCMSNEVDNDLHKHKAFLRLSISVHGILYAKLDKMKHNNEEPLLHYFKKRFPTFIILLESKNGTFVSDCYYLPKIGNLSIEKALKELEGALPVDPLLHGLKEENYHDLWKSFARSQIIEEREFSKRILTISKKWKKGITIENSKMKNLDVFFSEN